MEKYGLNQLRQMFLDFYKSKEHYIQKSFSLIPEKDKSLLIINSGMAPLKPYFAGTEAPPSKRMATCQKCIRTGDIENVGHTARHATFFEMLGSFSFGDYFKKESIQWGWEFITEILHMPEDKLWPSVYEEDEEAYSLWKDMIGIPEERIVRLGKDDNFWEIGTGPCGPCSELYFDRGEKYGCDNPDCKPGCDCDRYVEFWNHVFTQFSKDDAGNYTKLANPNIDTGMGLERLACIMQGVDSIFDIDTIRCILNAVTEKAGIRYKNGTSKPDISIRIITDHIRSVTFMISDGILPSNEGRGYVLRRLLRRAARHGKLLGIKDDFLAELADKVIEISSDAYPELSEKRDSIHKIIHVEEEKFSATIDQGNSILAEYIEELKNSAGAVLSGEKVLKLTGEKIFKLYDTFGFPLELTQEILEENMCAADVDGFNEKMLKQKETARAARKAQTDEGWAESAGGYSFDESTIFTGYEKSADTAKVKGITADKKNLTEIREGETAIIVLDRTPFYAESGGQASDKGFISNENCEASVIEVSKFKDIFGHKVKVNNGVLRLNDEVRCEVSVTNRNMSARNHTATHLLHKALRTVIGEHVNQAGSGVTADSLRFDFSHFNALSREELMQIEEIVNNQINLFIPVITREMPHQDAVKTGATGLFGEKYGDMVRVVSVGDFSMELCGGLHVANSGQIGAFKILSETGVAAGVRRIEAVTGTEILKRLNEKEDTIRLASEKLKVLPALFMHRIETVYEEYKAYKKELEELRRKAAGGETDELLSSAKIINGVKLVTKRFHDYSVNDLRNLSDDIKAANKGVVLVFVTENEGKAMLMVSVTDDLLERYHAGNMIKKIAAVAGGSGGGKADMAQAGIKDVSKIDDALAEAESCI